MDRRLPDARGHTSHKALRERLPWQTLATGEHWYTPYTFFEAAKDRVVDIFQPDIHWVGGFTAVQKITAIADAAGLEVICHAGMNTPYGQHFSYLRAQQPLGRVLRRRRRPAMPLKETNNYPGMAVPKDGYVVVSDEPGFGHGLSLDAIEKMAL